MTQCDSSKFRRLFKSPVQFEEGYLISVLDCHSVYDPFFPVGPCIHSFPVSDTLGARQQSENVFN